MQTEQPSEATEPLGAGGGFTSLRCKGGSCLLSWQGRPRLASTNRGIGTRIRQRRQPQQGDGWLLLPLGPVAATATSPLRLSECDPVALGHIALFCSATKGVAPAAGEALSVSGTYKRCVCVSVRACARAQIRCSCSHGSALKSYCLVVVGVQSHLRRQPPLCLPASRLPAQAPLSEHSGTRGVSPRKVDILHHQEFCARGERTPSTSHATPLYLTAQAYVCLLRSKPHLI